MGKRKETKILEEMTLENSNEEMRIESGDDSIQTADGPYSNGPSRK